MSPKTSSLAYDELKEDTVSILDDSFIPDLNLIIPKRMHSIRDAREQDLPIFVSGCITVSF